MKFSIRIKLGVVFLIFALAIILVNYIHWTHIREYSELTKSSLENTNKRVADKAASSLKELSKGFIKEKAIDVSEQVHHYLIMHAKTQDFTELQNNEELKNLAVQPVGKTGYTAVHDTKGINHFHVNPALVGTDLHNLAEKLPGFWKILEKSFTEESYGSYDWEDADGNIRAKYMYCAHVKNTGLIVCATTYMDEFLQGVSQLDNELNIITGAAIKKISEGNIKNSTIFTYGLGILLIATLILGGYISTSIIRPILNLTSAAKEIERGKLNQKIKIKTGDEIEELANSFNKMLQSIKKSKLVDAEHSKELESEVKKRTKQLKSKMDELEKTKQATLNILEDINEANEQLKELDLMKDDFLSVVSHELKTPITPITAYIEMLEDGDLGRVSKKQREALVTISRNTKRLKLLIEDVLDISRLQTGRMKFNLEKLDLNSLIKTTIADRQTFADEKQIKLVTHVEKLPKITTDRYRVTQVLTNLIDNSVKFSPAKSQITVTANRQNGDVRFTVADQGIGISKEDQAKVFGKFFQVDPSVRRKYGGTGLGLAICKGIIEMLGGNLSVKSKIGKGSEFYFNLPLKIKRIKSKGG